MYRLYIYPVIREIVFDSMEARGGLGALMCEG